METEMNIPHRNDKIYNLTLTVSQHYLVILKTTQKQVIMRCIQSNQMCTIFAQSLQCSPFPIFVSKFFYRSCGKKTY